ncbi:hypothetical protein [Halarchaeum sp. P4]|uniref:hypothetical protein n=1 Tax=Halarchaeum sp. P4 TaxID=3421639 RepID=UPI003EBD18FB
MSRVRRLAALALVVLLVSSSVAAPVAATGPASTDAVASPDVQPMMFFDATAEATQMVLDLFMSANTTESRVVDDGMNLSQETQDLKAAIYSTGATNYQQDKNTLTVIENYAHDSKNIAWMKAKTAGVEALNNGSTKIEMKNDMIEAVNDYYSKRVLNQIAQVETSTMTVQRMRHRAANASNISTSFVHFYGGNVGASSYTPNWQGTKNVTYTLPNGSTTTFQTIYWQAKFEASGGNTYYNYFHIGPSGVVKESRSNGNAMSGTTTGVKVEPPTPQYNATIAAKWSHFSQSYSALNESRTQILANIDSFVNSTYDSYQAGQINTSDLVDPYMLASEYSSTDGSSRFSYSAASLAMMGLQTPNLDNTSVMQVRYQNQTYNGLLMMHAEPSGGLLVNTTYNTSTFNGTEHIVTTTGEYMTLNDGANFTILSASTANGESLASVSYQSYNAQTADASNLTQQLQMLAELRDDIRERTAAAGSGGSSSDSSGMTPVYVLIGLSVLAFLAVVALQRDR